jgi:hypothetical protein
MESILLRPATKSELLERINQGRKELTQVIKRLSEAELVTPDPQTGWTIKDHLAHLAAWEIGIATLLQHRPRWPAMGLDETAIAASETDDLNTIIYQLHQNRPLAEVMTYFQEAHDQMLTALAQLSYEDLLKPYAHYQLHVSDSDSSDPILDWIAGNTYEHYAEHKEWIEAAFGRDER